jgi:hypothetical protein
MPRYDVIRDVQEYCADILEEKRAWTQEDAEHVASLFNQDDDPWGLFIHMDERTGGSDVGYQTKRTKREWFPILRQMRNTTGEAGLLEHLKRRSHA